MLMKRPTRRTALVLFVVIGALYMLPLNTFLASPSAGSFFSMMVAESGISIEREIPYGSHARHRLDVYRPKDDQATGPIVLFIYGGGWRSGDRAIYGFLGASFAKRGITTIIPDYRLHPDALFPTFMQDAALAYRWVYEVIARSTGDSGLLRETRPIIIMGHSAGAHIAALLTLDKQYLSAVDPKLPEPAALIGLAGPMAFDPTTDPTTKDIFANVKNADTARPLAQVRPGLPPVLLMHGLKDTRVRPWNSRQFAQALIKAGGKVCKVEVPGVGHIGLILAVSKPLRWRAPVLDTSLNFINSIVSSKTNYPAINC